VDATIYEKNGQIWMAKECPEHGAFDELYWSSAEMYHKAEKFSYNGAGVQNPQLTLQNACPYECGLCDVHLTSTSLANVDVTNRCNLRCEWCFANAHARGYVYEPSFEQLREMLATLRQEKPVPTLAVQFSGGEPTLREDLPEIIKMAVEMGFIQTQIATNGIRLAKDDTLARKLRQAGLNTVYLQFNGVSKETDGLIELKKKAIENCRNAGQGVVLVPTVARGLNDHEVGQNHLFCGSKRGCRQRGQLPANGIHRGRKRVHLGGQKRSEIHPARSRAEHRTADEWTSEN